MEVPTDPTTVVEFVPLGPPCPLPLYLSAASAGFPSPGDDYVDRVLDLHDLLVKHPAGTFFVRVQGDSMLGAGIHSGDILVVDRTLEPKAGRVVVAAVNGELVVKRVRRVGGRLLLGSHNDAYPPIEITEELEVVVWGIVTHVIHTMLDER